MSRHADENLGRISTDGKWMTYISTESGRREAYVTTFPVPDRKWRISSNGADMPRWRADGRELYFLDASQSYLMAVDITVTGTELVAGAPKVLFKTETRRRRDTRTP